jgi:hypothetical protein
MRVRIRVTSTSGFLAGGYARDRRPSRGRSFGHIPYTNPGNAPVDGEFVGPSDAWGYAPGGTGSVSISLRGLQPGNYVAYYLFNDGYESLREPIRFRIVSETRTPPRLLTPSLQLRNGQEDEPYSGYVGGWAVDPDGGELRFSLVRGPRWARLADNGTLTGRPRDDGSASYASARPTPRGCRRRARSR